MIDLDSPTVPANGEHEQTKNCANKPDQETESNPKEEEKSKRKVRANLTQDLWQRYKTEDLSMKDRQWIATLLTKLTDKRKAAKKQLFG